MNLSSRLLFVTGLLLVSGFATLNVTAQDEPDPNVHQFQKQDARIVSTTGTDTSVEIVIEGENLPTTVLMRDETGNWAYMDDSDGGWNNDRMMKANYQIEAGNHVWFEFGWSVPKDFITETSCAYSHKTFTRDCSIAEPPLPPIDLDFTLLGGNEWWVEVRLSGKSLESVSDFIQVFDDQGDSSGMDRLSNSRWGEGIRVPPGTRVMFQAYIPHVEDYIQSCWFVHPAGSMQCDDHKLPPYSTKREYWDGQWQLRGAIDHFEHFNVNDWWIEVQMYPRNNEHWDWQRVQVRQNGGDWTELSLRSWGSWALSTAVKPAAVLEFRAYDGRAAAWTYSTQGWTGRGVALQTVPSMDPAWDVVFANVKGNNWWVQVNTYSDEYTPRVQARVEGGAWRDLQFREWGDWAARFNVPTGKRVQFQALHEWDDTQTRQSGWHTWPPA